MSSSRIWDSCQPQDVVWELCRASEEGSVDSRASLWTGSRSHRRARCQGGSEPAPARRQPVARSREVAPEYCKRDRTASKRKCWSDRRSEFCVRRDFGHPATMRTQDTPPSLYSGHMIGCVYFLGAYGRLQDAPVGALPVHAHTQNSNVLGRGCLPFPYLTCFWADSCETTTIVFVF